jgi:hypothetical protein
MLHPDTLGGCEEFGYPNGYIYYGLGRGGVLGDVDADVIAAAFGFFEPSMVRAIWEAGVGIEGPRNSSRRYGAACASFGRARLGEWAGSARFIELASKIVAAAPVAGMSLFVGWRGEPRPADDAAHAYFLAHVMREWRGSAHVIAAISTGLTPLESILSGTGGAATAGLFGWGDSFGDVTHLAGKRNAAELLTDELCAVAIEASLDPSERAEFVALVGQLLIALDNA